MKTRIKVRAPFFGGRAFEKDDLQPLIPYALSFIAQDGYGLILEVEEEITQAQVDVVMQNIRAYIIANLITGEIIE